LQHGARISRRQGVPHLPVLLYESLKNVGDQQEEVWREGVPLQQVASAREPGAGAPVDKDRRAG
jgi:hypothetical protein